MGGSASSHRRILVKSHVSLGQKMTELLYFLCCSIVVLLLEGVEVTGDGERKSNAVEDYCAVKADKSDSICAFSISIVLLKMSSFGCCISSSKREVSRLHIFISSYSIMGE